MPRGIPKAKAVQAQAETIPAVQAQAETDMPEALRVLSLYGYFTDAGEYRQWSEGHAVTDPEEIADLIKRGAPVEEV